MRCIVLLFLISILSFKAQAQVAIEAPSLNVCAGTSSTLEPIIIREQAVDDFGPATTPQILVLTLEGDNISRLTNRENISVSVQAGASDVTSIDINLMGSDERSIAITYTVPINATNHLDEIEISGIEVMAQSGTDGTDILVREGSMDDNADQNDNLAALKRPHAFLNAIDFPEVSLLSSAGEENISICEGEAISFTAFPEGAAGYTFFVNGAPATDGVSGNTYTPTAASALNAASVTVEVDLGLCTKTSSQINVAIQDSPQILSTNLDGERFQLNPEPGETARVLLDTTVSVSPEGGNYQFTGPGVSFEPGRGHFFFPAAAGAGDHEIMVTYTLNGCSVSGMFELSVQGQIPFFVNPNNIANQYCSNSPVDTLQINPAYSAFLNFFLNGNFKPAVSGPGVLGASPDSTFWYFDPAQAGSGRVNLSVGFVPAGGNYQEYGISSTSIVALPNLDIAPVLNGQIFCEGDFSLTLEVLTNNNLTPSARIFLIAEGQTPEELPNDNVLNFANLEAGSYQLQYQNDNFGCPITRTENFQVKPVFVVSPNNSYFENFDSNEGNWTIQESNSSWEWGVPTGGVIRVPEGNAWITNLDGTYQAEEKSYVESPCFDISSLGSPIISLDYWVDTDVSDGAALFYTLDNGATWILLGRLNEGLNWYNQQDILGSPGGIGDNTDREGWSAQDTTWRTARFKLDAVQAVAGNNPIRFRVAFGSNGDNIGDRVFDGFAFDNITITERDRLVILEHFTNSQVESIQAEAQFVANFALQPANQSTLDLQYFANFPIDEPLVVYPGQKADISARALHYGVADLPYTVIDGNLTGPFLEPFSSGWGPQTHSQRTLVAPVLDIDLALDRNGIHQLAIQATVSRRNSNQPPAENLLIHFILLEYLHSSGATNLVKKFIPNTAGADRFLWNELESPRIVSQTWTPWLDIQDGQYGVVALVQGEISKEIFQATLQTIDFELLAPGGRGEQEAELPEGITPKDLLIYPNPGSQAITIQLQKDVPEAKTWILSNGLGKILAQGKIGGSIREVRLPTRSYPAGAYILQVDKVRKKIMILPE